MLIKQRSVLVPLVSLDLNRGLENSATMVNDKLHAMMPLQSPTKCGRVPTLPIEVDDQNDQNLTMNGFMTVTSAASVSKGDIELLENKISVLEK